ncbi:MAG: hypothetical protein ACFFAU_15325 [Candidatus Hodarchaeota archaeon]
MPAQYVFLPSLNRGKVIQIISFCLFIIISIFLFLQGLIKSIKFENPITKQPGLIGYLSTTFVIISILLSFSVLIARYYKLKYGDQNALNKTVLFHSNNIILIKKIRNKVIIGIENVKRDLNLEIQKYYIVKNDSTPKSALDFFPSEIKLELQTKIKSKTIFTLIEIAYQDPTETNPTKISKSLNVPPATLSREIKKLISINYLETHISDAVLQDTRLKNFKITKKGFIFLLNLKNALDCTITHFKEREILKKQLISLE